MHPGPGRLRGAVGCGWHPAIRAQRLCAAPQTCSFRHSTAGSDAPRAAGAAPSPANHTDAGVDPPCRPPGPRDPHGRPPWPHRRPQGRLFKKCDSALLHLVRVTTGDVWLKSLPKIKKNLGRDPLKVAGQLVCPPGSYLKSIERGSFGGAPKFESLYIPVTIYGTVRRSCIGRAGPASGRRAAHSL